MPIMRVSFMFVLLVATALAAAADDTLTSDRVEDYIRTRVATHKLQMRMKAHASEYQDVVRAFFRKRAALLKSRGWTVEEFERTQGRVLAAQSAMEEVQDRRRHAGDLERRKREIRANPHFTPEQKRKLIEMEEKLGSADDPALRETRPDWPAVRPYRKQLDQLVDWVAGNVPNPPDL